MNEKIEKMLKDGMNVEIELKTIAQAMLVIRQMHGENSLLEEFANDLTFVRRKRKKISRLIQSLPDDNTRQVFTHRYINALTWDDVADASYVSVAHAHRLHKKGLEKLKKVLDNIEL